MSLQMLLMMVKKNENNLQKLLLFSQDLLKNSSFKRNLFCSLQNLFQIKEFFSFIIKIFILKRSQP